MPFTEPINLKMQAINLKLYQLVIYIFYLYLSFPTLFTTDAYKGTSYFSTLLQFSTSEPVVPYFFVTRTII